MKKMTILDLCLCAMMAALHIVLELYGTVRIGNDLKITFATLPFLVIGLLCGPVEGLITGGVGTLLSQLLTYGITISTPFWLLPGMMYGLSAGLIYRAFGRKCKVVPIAVTTFSAGLVLVIFNLIASYFDGVVIYKYYANAGVLAALIPWRLLVWLILGVVYSIVAVPLTKAVQRYCPAGSRKSGKSRA